MVAGSSLGPTAGFVFRCFVGVRVYYCTPWCNCTVSLCHAIGNWEMGQGTVRQCTVHSIVIETMDSDHDRNGDFIVTCGLLCAVCYVL